ncbi:TNF receptor-associated factor 3 [Oopsacas minuta]|uniref:TNF receptor-associated factor 3 n=1 Tax=Oopsacas minuta TaxID=111878 RepID=A0AAV7JRW5_9METZ|nr:TNF receptor-associated factor 3 [Oopsacas minuta]
MAEKLQNNDTPETLIQALCVEITPGNFGGYKTEILLKELHPMVRELFLCYKCDNILRNAVKENHKSEDKLACSPCSGVQAGKKKGHIPHDARKMVGMLEVRCPYMERGCDWVGELERIITHLRECPHIIMICELGCKQQFLRKERDSHNQGCRNKNEICKFCDNEYRSHEEQKHFAKCLRYPIKCTQGCDNEVAREDMLIHLNSECSETIVKCLYGKLGCEIKELKRCEMIIHIREGKEKHEFVMRKAVQKLGDKIRKLEETNKAELDNVLEIRYDKLQSFKAEVEEKMGELQKAEYATKVDIGQLNVRLNNKTVEYERIIESINKLKTAIRQKEIQNFPKVNETLCVNIHRELDEISYWVDVGICKDRQNDTLMSVTRLEMNQLEALVKKMKTDLYRLGLLFCCFVVLLLFIVVGKWCFE